MLINAVSSQKVLIIHHHVAKCHKTHSLSRPMAEPSAAVIYGPRFRLRKRKARRRCHGGVAAERANSSFLFGLKEQMGDSTVRIPLALLNMTQSQFHVIAV